ncbi:SusD/RagB family nutrient-binding outer membrane lipoprotein [Mariniflexile sp. HMF6888]|uniref:SusD/RagB family nutrient-binding outer membrane lipoprotein n=1 Tax=Mariniflexile sp. HMF6888 TaxID=3373086 RepID=UPI00379EB17F
MKKILITIIGFGMLLSCSSQLDINRDPDDLTPDDLDFAVELPGGITGIAGVQGAPWALVGGIWSQFWAQSPGSSQYRVVDNYTLGTTDGISTTGWINAYDALLDIKNIKKKALAAENWNYYLIATVLESYTYQMLTDWYGDIPYTEATDPLIFNPVFDSAQDVYDGLIIAIDDALSKDLNASQGSAPTNDDLLFGGDMTNWVKFANTLKLKIYLRQTEARPSVAQAGITAMLNANTAFLNVSAAVTGFTDAPNISNPLYESDRRQLNTKNNLRASATMHSFLADNDDERLAAFYGVGNPVVQGDYNNPLGPATFSIADISPLAPVYFISLAESYFMQAEAMLRYNSGTGAKALYDAGVTAAFAQQPDFFDDELATEEAQTWTKAVYFNAAPYIASGGAYEYPASGFDDQLEAIIVQKWVASYPGNGADAFFEWQRTGYPDFFTVSVNGVLGTGFPQRLLYPNTETSRNSNAPDVVPITTPIWWNQ